MKMPDPNGTAFIMQFLSALDIKQYLYALSDALHSNLFELSQIEEILIARALPIITYMGPSCTVLWYVL